MRCFCPSCSQRRALEFGEWLCGTVLEHVPVRTCTCTMPKMLRPYFKYDHKLYPKFARCTYETLRDLLQAATGNSEAVPGMVIGIHTAGRLANHHPHLHGIFTSGGFDKDGNFRLLPTGLDVKKFEELLRLRILKMMLDEGKITRLIAEKLMNWNHSGFGAYTGDAIPADDRDARERAARYLVRAPISLEKLQYIPEEGKVVYGSPKGEKKVFDAMDFLALATSHITDRFEHRIIYYGYWANASGGARRKHGASSEHEHKIIEPVLSSREYRKRWAYFIKKIWESDPLVCPKCSQPMRILGFIDEGPVIKKILTHLGLWEVHQIPRAPPRKAPDLSTGYYSDGDVPWEDYRDLFYEEDLPATMAA